jgi:hypothetical protein
MLYMKIYIDSTGKNQQDHSCMHELMYVWIRIQELASYLLIIHECASDFHIELADEGIGHEYSLNSTAFF